MTSGWNKDFAEVLDLFALAEQKIKQIEHVSGRLKIPSVNQLRYAGKHVLDAMQEDVETELYQRSIAGSKDHCQRAIYDAMEIGILHYRAAIELFNKDYRTVKITEILPDYVDRIAEIHAIINEIGTTADRNSTKERADKHEQIQQQFERVQDIARHFEAAREELNKSKKKMKKEGKYRALKILYLILAIIAFVFALFYDFPWRRDGSQGRTPELPEKMQPVETDTTDSSTSVDTTRPVPSALPGERPL